MDAATSLAEKWPPVTVFYSYASEDDEFRQQLETHLSGLRRQGFISEWHKHLVTPGTDWATTNSEFLDNAQIILLLVSADFIASDYCYGVEMQRSLERHQSGYAYVVPIILRPVDWQETPLAKLEPLPRGGRPVTLWENRDAAFLDVVEGIRTIVRELRSVSQIREKPSQREKRIPLRPLHLIKDKNRLEMLRRVQKIAAQFFKQALDENNTFLELHLSKRPEAIDPPWHNADPEQEKIAPQRATTEKEILQIYDQAQGNLLLLGEAGSGKTTLLWKLTSDLLTRAFADDLYPIPIVLQLSSWANKRLPLATWLQEEISLRYKVPAKLAQLWIAHNRLLLLLDGLDELDLAHRAACIDELNRYHQEHYRLSLVVCCRNAAYFGQTERLHYGNAVEVQPLTLDQVNTYITNADTPLIALSEALHTDMALQKMATTPLMLHLLLQAYHDGAEKEHTTASPIAKRQLVFEHYVNHMLAQPRGTEPSYTPEQAKKWLVWLAQQMTRHKRMDFYLERIQPDWLTDTNWRGLFRLLVLLGIALSSSILSTIFYGLAYGTIALLVPGNGSFVSVWGFAILVIGLLGGLTGLLSNQIRRDIRPAEIVFWSWSNFWHSITQTGLRSGLIAGLIATILFSIPLDGSWTAALPISVPIAILFGLLSQTIRTRPASRPRQRQGLWLIEGLYDSGFIWIVTFTLILLSDSSIETGILAILIATLSALLSLIVTIDPNRYQDVYPPARLPLRSKLRTGIGPGLAGALLIGLCAGIISGLIITFFTSSHQAMSIGRLFGSFVTLVCWWFFGFYFGLINKYNRDEPLSRQVLITWHDLWQRAIQSNVLRYGTIFGSLSALIIGAGSFFVKDPLQAVTNIFIFGGIGFITGCIARIFLNGFSSQMREDEALNRPNQGIRDSWQNSIRIGLLLAITGYGIELLLEYATGLIVKSSMISTGLIIAILYGVCGWLLNGGIACIQHIILRWLLWQSGCTPKAYVHFLDYAADHHLLYKVGGGYTFIHSSLQEYFATAMHTEIQAQENTSPAQTNSQEI